MNTNGMSLVHNLTFFAAVNFASHRLFKKLMACLHVTLLLVTFLWLQLIFGKELYKGEFCPLKNNKTGVCEEVEKCSSAQRDLMERKKPGLCGFQGRSVIVCCEIEKDLNGDVGIKPNVSTSTEKSQVNETIHLDSRLSTSQRSTKITIRTGCQSFGNYVYRNETSPTLLPGILYDIINGCMVNETFAPGKVESGEFPHLVSIGYSSRIEPVYKCTGALISEEYVLTTASCTSTNFGFPVIIRLGTTLKLDYYFEIPEIQYIQVEEFIKHPDYDSTTKKNDIALIKLKQPAVINALTRPACLPEENRKLHQVIAVGYGSLGNFGEFKKDVAEDFLKLTASRICPRRTSRKNSGLYWCGQFENFRCVLDQGAPLQIINKSPYCTFSIVALVSSWDKCDPTKPMLITDVSDYVDWIEKTIWI